MTRIFPYLAAGVVALTSGVQTAKAASTMPEVRCSPRSPAKVEFRCASRALRHNRDAAHWIKYHRTLTVIPVYRTPHSLGYRLWQEKIDRRWIRQAKARLHPRLLSYAPVGFPPHHALWTCLHSVEAGSWYDHDSGGSGHYGGLQMGPDWLREFSGTADNYSQAQQEWFAERAYASSGYSPSFIYGQWLEWEHGAGDKCIPLE